MNVKYKYLIAFSIPAIVAFSLSTGDERAFLALIYSFLFLPALEFALPLAKENFPVEQEARLSSDAYYDWILWIMVPIQYGLLLLFCQQVSVQGIDLPSKVGLVGAFGISCSVLGINVAHELGHRKSKFERVLARMLLATSLNWQFYIEHNRGHHRYVGTPGDTETSLLNESLYAFWFRAIRDTFISALKRDPKEMALGLGYELGLLTLIGLSFGQAAVLGVLASSFFGILLLQSVNYIEHYGLTRAEISPGVYEPVRSHHSWNSSHALSRAFLFELSRHSDHHAYVTRKYPILRHLDESPQLPAGYPSMILLALIPSVWFRVMNPKVEASLNARSAQTPPKSRLARRVA